MHWRRQLLFARIATTCAFSLQQLSQSMGDNALEKVQWLGSRVASSQSGSVQGPLGDGGGAVYRTQSSSSSSPVLAALNTQSSAKETQVWQALATLEKDST